LQIVEDAPGGIGVFLQLQLLAEFLIARAAVNELRRFCCPVDAALSQQGIAFRLEEAEFKTAGAGVTNENVQFHLKRHRIPCKYPLGYMPTCRLSSHSRM